MAVQNYLVAAKEVVNDPVECLVLDTLRQAIPELPFRRVALGFVNRSLHHEDRCQVWFMRYGGPFPSSGRPAHTTPLFYSPALVSQGAPMLHLCYIYVQYIKLCNVTLEVTTRPTWSCSACRMSRASLRVKRWRFHVVLEVWCLDGLEVVPVERLVLAVDLDEDQAQWSE